MTTNPPHRNPLKSEAAAFRWVVIVGGAAAAVIAVTLLTRPLVGVVLAVALIAIGVGRAYRAWSRRQAEHA